MDYTINQMKYIKTVDGNARMLALNIIGELEALLKAEQDSYHGACERELEYAIKAKKLEALLAEARDDLQSANERIGDLESINESAVRHRDKFEGKAKPEHIIIPNKKVCEWKRLSDDMVEFACVGKCSFDRLAMRKWTTCPYCGLPIKESEAK